MLYMKYFCAPYPDCIYRKSHPPHPYNSFFGFIKREKKPFAFSSVAEGEPKGLSYNAVSYLHIYSEPIFGKDNTTHCSPCSPCVSSLQTRPLSSCTFGSVAEACFKKSLKFESALPNSRFSIRYTLPRE